MNERTIKLAVTTPLPRALAFPTLLRSALNDVVKYVATIFAKFRFHGAIKFSFSFRLCGIYVAPVAIIPCFYVPSELDGCTWDRAHVGLADRSLWGT